MATQASNSSSTWPPIFSTNAKVGGGRQPIVPDGPAVFDLRLDIVSTVPQGPPSACKLTLDVNPAGRPEATQRLIDQLKHWVAELERRPNEVVHLETDLDGLINS
jgi:hypothetical protein